MFWLDLHVTKGMIYQFFSGRFNKCTSQSGLPKEP